MTFFQSRARQEAVPYGAPKPLPDGRGSDLKDVANFEALLEPPARLVHQWDERLALPPTMLADVPADLIITTVIVVLTT